MSEIDLTPVAMPLPGMDAEIDAYSEAQLRSREVRRLFESQAEIGRAHV